MGSSSAPKPVGLAIFFSLVRERIPICSVKSNFPREIDVFSTLPKRLRLCDFDMINTCVGGLDNRETCGEDPKITLLALPRTSGAFLRAMWELFSRLSKGLLCDR